MIRTSQEQSRESSQLLLPRLHGPTARLVGDGKFYKSHSESHLQVGHHSLGAITTSPRPGTPISSTFSLGHWALNTAYTASCRTIDFFFPASSLRVFSIVPAADTSLLCDLSRDSTARRLDTHTHTHTHLLPNSPLTDFSRHHV